MENNIGVVTELFGIPLNKMSVGRTRGHRLELRWRREVAAVFGPVKLAMNDSVFPEGIREKSVVLLSLFKRYFASKIWNFSVEERNVVRKLI